MKSKSTSQQISDQIEHHIGEETNRNKIFVVLLGFLILGMAFFGKIINDDANNAFDKVEQHFSLSNDYLSYVFDTYSCVTVDGIVKIAFKIKDEKEVLSEMKERFPIAQEKLKYYIENTPCHQKELIKILEIQTKRTDPYWDKIMKNIEDGNGVIFANDILESGELYKYTDDILLTINSLLNCHLETAKTENDKCQKSLKSFKRICIVSSSVGLTIIMAVILKFFSEKNEIQKRRIDNISRKSVGRKKATTPRKKAVPNKK
jgi:predicted XRE-type DNA-binding protein